jgi:hypothetical protein
VESQWRGSYKGGVCSPDVAGRNFRPAANLLLSKPATGLEPSVRGNRRFHCLEQQTSAPTRARTSPAFAPNTHRSAILRNGIRERETEFYKGSFKLTIASFRFARGQRARSESVERKLAGSGDLAIAERDQLEKVRSLQVCD